MALDDSVSEYWRAKWRQVRLTRAFGHTEKSQYLEEDMGRKYSTPASMVITDTTLGGNISINAPPQFTHTADIPAWANADDLEVMYDSKNGGVFRRDLTKPYSGMFGKPKGMGRYYYESLESNSVRCHMRMGVPEYNSLTQFFGNFYDPKASALARTGFEHKTLLSAILGAAGKAVGFLISLPFYPIVLFGAGYRYLTAQPASKFFNLKPTMHLYWSAVDHIVNGVAVNMGIVPFGNPTYTQQQMYGMKPSDAGTSQNQMLQVLAEYHRLFPRMITEDGRIDVFVVATRAQGLASNFNKRMMGDDNSGGLADAMQSKQAGLAEIGAKVKTLTQSWINDNAEGFYSGQMPASTKTKSFADYIKNWSSVTSRHLSGNASSVSSYFGTGAQYNVDNATIEDKNYKGGADDAGDQLSISELISTTYSGDSASGGESTGGDSGGTLDGVGSGAGTTSQATDATAQEDQSWIERLTSWASDYYNFMVAATQDGQEWVSFRVTDVGTIGESFSSSTTEPSIKSKINQQSEQSRMMRIDFADGNLTGGAVGAVVDQVKSAVSSVVSGVAEGLHMSGIAALMGSAFVDIPEVWQASQADLPKADFTIKLRSPYGNKMSRLQNLVIPLACLLATGLPLATGRKSHTSPFIVEAYCRGRFAIKLGLVDRISVTRGQGNVGWTRDGQPLGIDVSFSIKDLSSIMTMPVTTQLGTAGSIFMAGVNLVGGGTAAAYASALVPSTWDEDNSYTDYLGVLGGLDMQDFVNASNRWKLSRFRAYREMQRNTSQAGLVSTFFGTPPGRVLQALSMKNSIR
jgi:hypothetical protein